MEFSRLLRTMLNFTLDQAAVLEAQVTEVEHLQRLLAGGIELGQVNGGWLMLFVGGIVVPGGGLPLGYEEMSRFAFGVSAAIAPE